MSNEVPEDVMQKKAALPIALNDTNLWWNL